MMLTPSAQVCFLARARRTSGEPLSIGSSCAFCSILWPRASHLPRSCSMLGHRTGSVGAPGTGPVGSRGPWYPLHHSFRKISWQCRAAACAGDSSTSMSGSHGRQQGLSSSPSFGAAGGAALPGGNVRSPPPGGSSCALSRTASASWNATPTPGRMSACVCEVGEGLVSSLLATVPPGGSYSMGWCASGKDLGTASQSSAKTKLESSLSMLLAAYDVVPGHHPGYR